MMCASSRTYLLVARDQVLIVKMGWPVHYPDLAFYPRMCANNYGTCLIEDTIDNEIRRHIKWRGYSLTRSLE